MGEGKWRSIESTPDRFPPYLSSHKTFVSEALHWVDDLCGCDDNYIQAFHFGREQFLEFPAPAELGQDVLDNEPSLGVLRGCLSVQCTFKESQQLKEIWVLRESSWSNDFVIDMSFCDKHTFFRPIMTMDSGEVLILFDERFVILYNPCCQAS